MTHCGNRGNICEHEAQSYGIPTERMLAYRLEEVI